MTRIVVPVPRGSAGSSSSNPSRSSSTPSSSTSVLPQPQPQPQSTIPQVALTGKDEEIGEEVHDQVVLDDFAENLGSDDNKAAKRDSLSAESFCSHQDNVETVGSEKVGHDDDVSGDLTGILGAAQIVENETEKSSGGSLPTVTGSSAPPPPPPVPPPKPSSGNSNYRGFVLGSSNSPRTGSSRRATVWPVVSARTLSTGSRPPSPRSHCEGEGYNSDDEQGPCFGYDDGVSFVSNFLILFLLTTK